MSYNDMLSDFQTILARDDCTTAQAQTFLNQGIARVQRDCRLPSMERAQLITASQPMLFFPAPPDLIQPIDLIVPEVTSTTGQLHGLKKTSYRELVRKNPLLTPQWYARSQTLFYIRGALNPGQTLQFIYYGNFSPFATPDSENELSASTPDLAVYAALHYAGDNFVHPSTAQWEATYQQLKAEVVQMAVDLDAEGGTQTIAPIYNWDD